MDQVEILKQTLIKKNNEITELKRLLGTDTGPRDKKKAPIQKSMWAMLFVLCEKYVKCEKCSGKTKPAANKNNYMLARCTRCNHFMDIKRSKGAAMNAYWDEFKGKYPWLTGKT